MFAGVLLHGVEERRITNDIPHASPELSDSETQQRNITDIWKPRGTCHIWALGKIKFPSNETFKKNWGKKQLFSSLIQDIDILGS